MKRSWARFITVAALGCLLALGASPASAYYPPLKGKTTKKGSHEVTFQVKDPQDGWHINMYMYVTELVQGDGVIAMIRRIPNPGGEVQSNSVTYVTYDPSQKDFVEHTEGGYGDISQLQVADGVVAYIATIQESQPVFAYATYDPIEKSWRHMQWKPIAPDNVGRDRWVITSDGVVLYGFKYDGAGYLGISLYADIYHPLNGNWQTGLDGYQNSIAAGQDPDEFKDMRIDNATIYFTRQNRSAHTKSEETRGYDNLSGTWYPGPTEPMAYFAAQPSISSPLWVWFTDLSIGGAKWEWAFGDGATDNKRSTSHPYTNNGNYVVEQRIEGNGNNLYSKTISVGP